MIKLVTGAYLICNLLFHGWNFTAASINENNRNIDQFRVAENLTEYFEYISKTPVTSTSDIDRVIPVQLMLDALGYNIGVCGADGIPGPDFTNALVHFQTDQKNIAVNGTADTLTLSLLSDYCLADPQIYNNLSQQIIEPFTNENVERFMSEVEDKFDIWGMLPFLIIRPDVQVMSLREANLNDKRIPSHGIFNGCYNHNLIDCFRHAQSLMLLSDEINFSSNTAESMCNMREVLSTDNPLPCRYMDMFNHMVAKEIYHEMREQGIDITPETTEKYILDGIQNNRLITVPFPLVAI